MNWIRFAFLAISLAAGPAFSAQKIVLPKGIVPLHYDLTIQPDAAALSFSGEVAIDLDVEAPGRSITLNALDLQFGRIELDGAVAPVRILEDAARQTARLDFSRTISSGRHRLKIDYQGKIGRSAQGLFAADYQTPEGEKRILATQFEPSDARRLMPCFDEPALKATITLSAVIPQGAMAVSNMPEARRETLDARHVRLWFQQTPRMSTYLLFFAMGDLERRSRLVDGVDVGVVVKRGSLDQADYALAAIAEILPFYNEYFGIPYPLPKLDLIAIPLNGGFSAMENWGAVLYFEHAMLLDPNLSVARERRRIFRVIAHETAHQWFGDLVTMAWWDDLWLNEGFAEWMEGKAAEHFHPEWQVGAGDELDKEAAIRLDASPGTHAIVQPVYSAVDAGEAFDDITYLKGQAVIRMLEAHMGSDVFRDGVRRYMKAHAYGNAVTNDLWRELEAAGGAKTMRIAEDFTRQPYVPLLQLKSADCVQGHERSEFSTRRFELDPISGGSPQWSIPVELRIAPAGASLKQIVSGEANAVLEGCGPVLLNAGQSGYFVVQDTKKNFDALSGVFPGLSLVDQIGLISNAALSGDAGIAPASDLLELIQSAPLDANSFLWVTIFERLETIDRYFDSDAIAQARFEGFIRKLAQPLFVRIGWDAKPGEDDNDALLRQSLIRSLGEFGDAQVLAECRRRFEDSNLPAGIREAVLEVVAYHADAPTLDQLIARAKAAPSPLERDAIFEIASEAHDPAAAERFREIILAPGVPESLTPRLLEGAARIHPDETWTFAKAHWHEIARRLDSIQALEFMPEIAANSFNPAVIADMRRFAKEDLPKEAERPAIKAETQAKTAMRIRREVAPQIDRWLQRVGN